LKLLGFKKIKRIRNQMEWQDGKFCNWGQKIKVKKTWGKI